MGLNQISDHLQVMQRVLENSFKDVSPELYKSISISKEILEKNLNFYDSDKIWKGRAVTMMFLDKMGATMGGKSPYVKFVDDNYTGGMEIFVSLEMINLLEQIKNDVRLPEEGKDLIEKWIDEERSMFTLALLVTYLKSSVIKGLMVDGHDLSVSEWILLIDEYIKAGKKDPIDKEASILFQKMMVEHLKEISPNESVKVPAGCLGHATRVIIEKDVKGDYRLFHSNTGLGCNEVTRKSSTLTEYSPIPKEKLENLEFWEKFIDATTQQDMKAVNRLLGTLVRNPKHVNEQKDPQQMGSCSAMAIGNEIRHFFINHASTPETGRAAYAISRNLMLAQSQKNLEGKIHPFLQERLLEKEMVRNRYFAWVSIIAKQSDFVALKEGYLSAMHDLLMQGNGGLNIHTNGELNVESRYVIIKLKESIKSKDPLTTLKILDQAIDKAADNCTIESLGEIRSKYSELFTFEGVNYLGLRSKLRLENTKLLFDEVFSDREVKMKLFDLFSVVSKHLFPKSFAKIIDRELYLPKIPYQDLISILADYLKRQTFSVAQEQVIQGLRNDQLSLETLRVANSEFCFVVFEEYGIELIEKLCKNSEVDTASINACKLMVENYHSNQSLIHKGPKVLKASNYKVIEDLLVKASNPEVKEMLSSLLNAIAFDLAKEMITSGELIKALSFAKDFSLLEFIVDAHLAAGGTLEVISDYITNEIVEPLQSGLLGGLGELYLRQNAPNRALGLAAKISTSKVANNLLEKIVWYHVNKSEMDVATNLLKLNKIEGDDNYKIELAIALKLLGADDLKELALFINGCNNREKLIVEMTRITIDNFKQDADFNTYVNKISQMEDENLRNDFQVEIFVDLIMKSIDRMFTNFDETIEHINSLVQNNVVVVDRILHVLASKLFAEKKIEQAFKLAKYIHDEGKRNQFVLA